MVLSNESKRDIEADLKKEQDRVRDRDLEIQKLRAELKRMDMLRPSNKVQAGGDKKLNALRRELQDTQDKLTREKRKNATLVAAAAKVEGSNSSEEPIQLKREKPSLTDFVPDVIVNSKPAGESNRSLDSATSAARPPPPPPVSPYQQPRTPSTTDISFDGVNTSYDSPGNPLEERVKSELNFLSASYDNDEVKIEAHKVTRTLLLPIDRNDDEKIVVHLNLLIKDGYPNLVPLKVDASIWPYGSTTAVDAQKVATDALSSLVDVCQCEANGSLGNEALLSTLQAADQWVYLDWVGIQAKRLTSKPKKNKANSRSADRK